jgi:hypothetical protein
VVDVDEVRRGLDLELHQVDEVRPAGEELGPRLAGDGGDGGTGIGGALVGERLHLAASATAGTMFA